jgi:uncharacterized protein YjlB
MYVIESIKRAAERMTGRRRATAEMLSAAVRSRKPRAFRFKDDGRIPNNPVLPLILYSSAVRVRGTPDPAALLEQLFEMNGWGDSWRNGIYDYVHYHSRIHEVLGVARGHARVRFGGDKGKEIGLKEGDVAILPAGTGHQCLAASEDFLVVGAYPPVGTYDECRGSADEYRRARRTVPRVGQPKKDPLYGRAGPLTELWRDQR